MKIMKFIKSITYQDVMFVLMVSMVVCGESIANGLCAWAGV